MDLGRITIIVSIKYSVRIIVITHGSSSDALHEFWDLLRKNRFPCTRRIDQSHQHDPLILLRHELEFLIKKTKPFLNDSLGNQSYFISITVIRYIVMCQGFEKENPYVKSKYNQTRMQIIDPAIVQIVSRLPWTNTQPAASWKYPKIPKSRYRDFSLSIGRKNFECLEQINSLRLLENPQKSPNPGIWILVWV